MTCIQVWSFVFVCVCMCVSIDEFRVVKLEDVLSHLDLSSLLLPLVRCALHCGQSCVWSTDIIQIYIPT